MTKRPFAFLIVAIALWAIAGRTAFADDEPIPMECKDCDIVVVDGWTEATDKVEIAVSIPMWMYENIDMWWLQPRIPPWLNPPKSPDPRPDPPDECDVLANYLTNALGQEQKWAKLIADAERQGGFIKYFLPFKSSNWIKKGSKEFGASREAWMNNQQMWNRALVAALRKYEKECKEDN